MPKNISIIGAGHNGLVAACYLAKAGHKVKIFEKRHVVGGCASTNTQIFSGFKVSEAAYVNSLFLPEIVKDLNLKKYGYEVLPRNPSSFTPLPNGQYLLLGPDEEFNYEQISRFSKKDAQNFKKYEQALEEIAEFIDSTLSITPPHFVPRSSDEFKTWLSLTSGTLGLGPKSLVRLARLMFGNPVKFLDSWFETDALKATLLTDALIGATDLSGYVLLHHVMGTAGGARGVWGYQRGGMGGISNALAKCAKDLGVEIYLNCPVNKLIVRDGRVAEIAVADGTQFYFSDIVISGIDANNTFLNLIPEGNLPKRFEKQVKKINYESASMKINLALKELPSFKCLPLNSAGQHRATIHISPSVDYILRALQESKNGFPSTNPILELTIPSTLDETLTPKGRHVMNIFCQFTPYDLHPFVAENWDTLKESYFKNNVMAEMRKYISNIDEIIEGVQIISPLDLETDFGLSGGNIFQGSMNLKQLFSGRPVRGYSNYKTPLKNLYMCGAATHPGGGVTGACGLNAAREILKDLSKNGSSQG